MSKVLIDLQYLPSLEFFACITQYDEVLIEAHENYVKQTYRNRANILSANGVSSLTVPVVGGNKKTKIKSLKIDNTQKWQNNHWRSIQSAYGKAPYFEFYADEFNAVYQSSGDSLFEFNWQLLTLCLKCLQYDKPIQLTDSYVKQPEGAIVDMRSVIHPKKDFSDNDIYTPVPYIQLFGNKFAPNLSVIDLLCCEGPNASTLIKQSIQIR